MDPGVFAADAELAGTHWWHVGRRRLFAREITRLALPRHARILDIGTSAGTNLQMLQEMGFESFSGLDQSTVALEYCRRRGFTVREGDITALPDADRSLDAVLATDVIEHVDDDAAALAEIARVLTPGGAVLITVPAFQSLWGLQDEVAHHKRRYRKAELMRLVAAAGLVVERHYYFNYILFVPIFAARMAMKAANVKVESEAHVNTPALNWILSGLFNLDIATAPYVRPPFGVSALVLARKPAVTS